MTSPKVPPGAERVARGKRATKHGTTISSAHKPGKQTEAEHNKIASAGKGHTINVASGGKK
jgi:hypothetical protein